MEFATSSAWVKISNKVSFYRPMPQLQKPNANLFKVKQLDSQAWNIYALLAIFEPFLLYFARLIGDFDSNHARGMHERWCRLILGDGVKRRLQTADRG